MEKVEAVMGTGTERSRTRIEKSAAPAASKKRKAWLTIRRDVSRNAYLTVAISSFALMAGIWSIVSYGGFVERTFLPYPHSVLLELFRQLANPEYWNHIGISVFRVMAGFILACALGVPLGLLAGTFKAGEAFVEPPMEFVRYMPAVAFIPLLMVWTGIGEWTKVLVIFIGCFFQLVLMVAINAKQVPDDLIQASYTLGAGRRQTIETVILPYMMPNLMNTMRLILGWAWTYLVVAELVAVNSGLGYAIMKAQRFLNTEQIFVGIIVIGLLGLMSDRLFAFFNRRLYPWV
ncbi:ABC transporter permease [Paenibacillus alkalitolerans]|uniref:ABC transporter permease n=1 Tax=Paenibacillus alkalitolerans TaxID=2799335 RepID=UPI002D7F2887|nr:ABC transporter permease [Paenibacillus alkalitolerans]